MVHDIDQKDQGGEGWQGWYSYLFKCNLSKASSVSENCFSLFISLMINLNEGDRVRAKDLSWGNLEVPQPAWESWWIRSRHLPPCVPSGGLWSLKYTLSSLLRVSDDYFARWSPLQSMRISPSPCWQSRFPISCLGLHWLFVHHIVIEKKLCNQCDDGCLHIWAFQHLVFKSSAPGTFSPSLPLSAGLTFDVWFIGKKNHLCLWLITHIPQNFRGRTFNNQVLE